jgi:hypothetical protein
LLGGNKAFFGVGARVFTKQRGSIPLRGTSNRKVGEEEGIKGVKRVYRPDFRRFLGVKWEDGGFSGIWRGIVPDNNPPKKAVFFIQWQVFGLFLRQWKREKRAKGF